MINKPQIYFIRWKIPILDGSIQPTQFSEIKKGRGKIKRFSENGIELTLFRKAIAISIEIESINPHLAFVEFISRLNNVCNLLQIKYFCELGGAQMVKSNLPEELLSSLQMEEDDFTSHVNQDLSLIYV